MSNETGRKYNRRKADDQIFDLQEKHWYQQRPASSRCSIDEENLGTNRRHKELHNSNKLEWQRRVEFVRILRFADRWRLLRRSTKSKIETRISKEMVAIENIDSDEIYLISNCFSHVFGRTKIFYEDFDDETRRKEKYERLGLFCSRKNKIERFEMSKNWKDRLKIMKSGDQYLNEKLKLKINERRREKQFDSIKFFLELLTKALTVLLNETCSKKNSIDFCREKGEKNNRIIESMSHR